MKRTLSLILIAFLLLPSHAKTTLWPDGTKMDAFFSNTKKVDVKTLGKQYVITDYGVKNDSTLMQTTAIQAVIDRCASEGGGVVVVPDGTFLCAFPARGIESASYPGLGPVPTEACRRCGLGSFRTVCG